MSESTGSRLKHLRIKYNYKREDVSEYLSIPVGHLDDIESDKREIILSQIFRLCDLYKCSEEYLICGQKTKFDNEVGFRKDNECVDLNTIARMNKVIKDIELVIDLEENMA